MIFSLLYVGLLCMGVGAKASTPIYNNRTTQKQQRQLQEENDTTDYTITFSSSINNHVDNTNVTPTIIPYVSTSNVQLRTGKTTYNEVSNDALLIKSISYASNYRQFNGSSYTTQYATLLDDYKDLRRATCGLNTIQITPYLQTLQNVAHIKTGTRIAIGAPTNRQLVLRNEYYISQDPNVSSAIWDISNYYTQYDLYDRFDTINTSTYTGQYFYRDHTITTNISNTVVYNDDIDITIPIIRNNGNPLSTYIVCRSYIYLVYSQGYSDIVTCYNIDTNEPIAPAANHTLNGTMINAAINYEVVDIPGLMWEILTMPFTFISTAFNLTIFPGTSYQVNFSNLFLMIFAVMVFLFIMKMLLKR